MGQTIHLNGFDPIKLQRTGCLVVSPCIVGNHAYLFSCATTGVQSAPYTELHFYLHCIELFQFNVLGVSACV